MPVDWLEMTRRLAAGARAKVAEDRRRLEELQAQKADARCGVEASAVRIGIQVHPGRTVHTDQSRMEGHACVLTFGAGVFGRAAKVDAIPRHKRPISIEDEGFQLPVFPSCFAQPYNVGALRETAVPRYLYQIQAQALVDQKFEHAFILP